ncbi:MAG: hypothetical protein ACR2H5_23845 [Ktedonobacteraceae bacterium]
MKSRSMLSIIALLGMIVLVLTACGGASSSKTNQVNVSLSDFKVQSSQTMFVPGQTYHFVVTNDGHTNHEFMVMPPMTTGMNSMEQMDKMALYHISSDQLPPGASKSFDYSFPSSATQQSLEFSCHLPGHYEAGMHLPITLHS